MIPRLKDNGGVRRETTLFLESLARTAFSGEIRADFSSRLVLATDNSIYQLLPEAVIFPKTEADLVEVFRLADRQAFQSVTFSLRGGGTGTNGQSLSGGIVLDCSKYMTQILELDLEAGWVWVQPGVVLDRLNAVLKPHGVFFAPALATSSRATIGGMINTDACGKGSRVYGRTSDHLLELTWVLSDGTLARSHSISPLALAQAKQQPGRLGAIYRQVDAIVRQKQTLIEQTFPKMPRFMTGYNLAKVYDAVGEQFNLNWILAGSEGTLAAIAAAKLKLSPIPQHKRLLVVRYCCFDDALHAAQVLLEFGPTAIETLDEKILTLAQQDEIYRYVKDSVADASAINLVEFSGYDFQALQTKIDRICHYLENQRNQSQQNQPQQATGYALIQDARDMANLWELRKKGVGLLGNQPGNRKPIAFIEDTAVPPSQLAAYIQEFKALLAEYQLDYGMFGHVDVGCIHVRPALDTKRPDDAALVRELSDKVVSLVRKYGGVLWGEHGKGFRSEYTPAFFGEELYQDLRRIKAAFDPENRLNPGKIVTPFDSNDPVASLEAPLRGEFDRQVSTAVRQDYDVAFSCNGNGACFNVDPETVMCPSYKGGRYEEGTDEGRCWAGCDRIHSPKGRASLLREWLRQLEAATPKNSTATLEAEWRESSGSWLAKLWHTLHQARGTYDYSQEVYDGMKGCLSCKACASQCPIHVDIPSLKAKFLHRYHSRYLRPWRDYFMGYSEILAQWQAIVPDLFNSLTQSPLIRYLLRHSMGLIDIPAASRMTVKQGLANRQVTDFNLNQLASLNDSERKHCVILLQDAFTSFYEAQLVLDTYDLLRQWGYTVCVLPFSPSGKPLHVLGFLPQFRTIVQKNLQFLEQLVPLNIPLIGIEPSIALAYRDEYIRLANTPADCPKVLLLQEFLHSQLHRLPQIALAEPRPAPYFLLGHCTEKALVPDSQQQWQQIFQAVGLSLSPLATGCCGMAGIYGHEAEHYVSSQGIYQFGWQPKLPVEPGEREYFLATGYSCRTQVQRFSGWTPLHPIQALHRCFVEG